ncbi:hypothetical protein [Kocuria rhizophila]|uniref:Hypothetical membrane protein n=1 Tax=Kocuria rhizophila (strain ATCC 9341 / DSM 348 / NBRC 103217 / DC2201) TaxID=378753 RepID=B2GKE7_KOCRD|nr:hypothetical protein [Kocuria rhizophila]ASE10245.1 hypothetical protein CEP81_00255 [Kocuria rhizophila]MBK4121597.1 hypothetical protein [Kocuria rhizophila]MCC5671078.1 hypothetical protein [Kocuria rhizophila]VEH74820.1 Uncharacterised protein [Kocuria rhizophila]BAG29906.1 hypothetical membrane protein [Kocuria rhizophila DC2201]
MSHELIDFHEQQDEHAPRSRGWLIVAMVLVGAVLTVVLGLLSALSFDKASHLQDWAGETMVVSGTYQTLTKDLTTQDYNGIYAGVMPGGDLVERYPYDNRLNDPVKKAEGDQITFRGTQSGVQDGDFPREVDALLAVQDGTLRVVETDAPGAYGTDGVTDSTVTGQRLTAAAWGVGALLCAGLTVWGVRRVHRGVRPGV